MQLRTRRILFWSLIPCFVIGGTGMVLYSQGYRLDPSSQEVTKVGALYVRGYPREATITLDDQRLDTGSWWPLQSGTLIGSLVPGKYRLHAESPGYQDWEADIVIRATLVTERKSLTLFPEQARPLSEAPADVTGIDAPGSLSDLVLTSPDTAHVGETSLFGAYVGTSRGRVITMSSEVRRGVRTPILRTQVPGSASATTVAAPGTLLDLQEDTVLVQEKKTLVAGYDGTSATRSVVASSTDGSTVSHVLRTGSHDAWAEGAAGDVLAIRPRGSQQAPRLVELPAPIESLQPSASQIGVLDASGSLWLVDPQSGAKQEIGHRAGWASWNPDGTSVLGYIDGNLEVIPLKEGIVHGVLEGVFTGKPSLLGKVRWYPDVEHFFIEVGGELLFVDIVNGEASEQHVYRMALPKAWAFDAEEKLLWVLGADRQVSSYQFPD
jgi:hypothetical protein